MLMPRAKRPKPEDAPRQPLSRSIGEERSAARCRPYRRSCHTLLVQMAPCSSTQRCAGVRHACRAGAVPSLPVRSMASVRPRRAALTASRRRSRSRVLPVTDRRAEVPPPPCRRRACSPTRSCAASVAACRCRHLGAHQRPPRAAGVATTRPRPSPGRSPASSACPAGGCCTERTAHRRPASRGRPPGRPGVPRPPAAGRPDGAGCRRRRHHRRHVAGSGRRRCVSAGVTASSWSPRPAPSCARRRWASCDQWQADRAAAKVGPTSPVGCAPAWASSIASSALVKARS